MKQEVVEHRGNAVDHDGVAEDGAYLGRHHLERVNRLVAHDVVESRQHAHVPIAVLGLRSLRARQALPRAAVTLRLLLADLRHVLSQ